MAHEDRPSAFRQVWRAIRHVCRSVNRGVTAPSDAGHVMRAALPQVLLVMVVAIPMRDVFVLGVLVFALATPGISVGRIQGSAGMRFQLGFLASLLASVLAPVAISVAFGVQERLTGGAVIDTQQTLGVFVLCAFGVMLSPVAGLVGILAGVIRDRAALGRQPPPD